MGSQRKDWLCGVGIGGPGTAGDGSHAATAYVSGWAPGRGCCGQSTGWHPPGVGTDCRQTIGTQTAASCCMTWFASLQCHTQTRGHPNSLSTSPQPHPHPTPFTSPHPVPPTPTPAAASSVRPACPSGYSRRLECGGFLASSRGVAACERPASSCPRMAACCHALPDLPGCAVAASLNFCLFSCSCLCMLHVPCCVSCSCQAARLQRQGWPSCCARWGAACPVPFCLRPPCPLSNCLLHPQNPIAYPVRCHMSLFRRFTLSPFLPARSLSPAVPSSVDSAHPTPHCSAAVLCRD